MEDGTDMGVWYVFSKSRPLRFAFTNVGPKAGTKYSVEMKANIENPTDVYSAGRGGAGSRSGLTTNHVATGAKPKSKTGESGRGPSILYRHVSNVPGPMPPFVPVGDVVCKLHFVPEFRDVSVHVFGRKRFPEN